MLSGKVRLPRYRKSGVGVTLELAFAEAMHGHARLQQSVSSLSLLQHWLADLHALPLGASQDLLGSRQGRLQIFQSVMHGSGLHEPGIPFRVTLRAHSIGARADHFVSGMLDCMIAVAGDATWEPHRRERILVRAGLEQLRLEDVAIRTDIGNVGDPRGRRSVIAMARRAGRRAQVATYHHGVMVHTLLVIRELVGLDAVWLHVLGIGVAM